MAVFKNSLPSENPVNSVLVKSVQSLNVNDSLVVNTNSSQLACDYSNQDNDLAKLECDNYMTDGQSHTMHNNDENNSRGAQAEETNSTNSENSGNGTRDEDTSDINHEYSGNGNIPKEAPMSETLVSKCKCMYTNADQLQNKMDELNAQVSLVTPDFIFVTEVLPKLNVDNISCSSMIYHIDGYTAFPSTDKGRGVIIYAKSELNVSPNIYLNSLYPDASWVDWINDEKSVVLGSIYRSPSDARNCESICELLNVAVRTSDSLLITGDFNMKDIDWESCSTIHSEGHHETMFIECLRDNFLFQHVNHFTRCRNDQARNILDLIISKDENNVEITEILPSLGCSDHVTLLFDFLCDFQEISTGTSSYKYRKCDLLGFTREWQSIDWNECFKETDVNGMWNVFESRFKDGVESFCPRSSPKKGFKPKPLWMKGDTLTHIKKKRHAWNKYLATRRDEDYELYKQVRNTTNEVVKNSKRQFEKQVSQKAKSEPKQFWRYVKSKVKSKPAVFNLKKDDGEFVRTDKEKAELLNNFFSSVFTTEDVRNIPNVDDKPVHSPLIDIPISETEVKKLLKDMDATKSMGPDDIHPYLLKCMVDVFVEPLTLIFQKSVSSGKIPTAWKDARVSPIFKKGSKTDPSNYRPVSLTSVVCKLLEKLVRKHIMDHLHENNLLSNEQYGFRNKRSCALQLLHVMEEWNEFVDERRSWDTVYLDLAKAFDKVAHKKLVKKVSSFGIKGNVLAWIEDFLSGRRQCVSIKGNTSEWKDVISGVPQGSVLGPVLFVLYVNDVVDHVDTNIKVFADDTKLYAPSTDSDRLQSDIQSLCDWANKWELTFNVGKCKVIHYGYGNPEKQYVMGTEELQTATEENDLGVIFERDLKFSKHISSKINKANAILALIKRTFDYIDIHSFIKLYTALVRPHVEFANVVWHPYLRKDIDSLERLQMRATKLVPHLRDLEYQERLKELKLPSLSHRRLRGDVIQTFKIVKGIDDCIFENFFRYASSTRGHNLKLEKPLVRSTFGQNKFSSRVIDSWNNLPQHVVEAKDVNIFKNRLDRHWQGIMYQY